MSTLDSKLEQVQQRPGRASAQLKQLAARRGVAVIVIEAMGQRERWVATSGEQFELERREEIKP